MYNCRVVPVLKHVSQYTSFIITYAWTRLVIEEPLSNKTKAIIEKYLAEDCHAEKTFPQVLLTFSILTILLCQLYEGSDKQITVAL